MDTEKTYQKWIRWIDIIQNEVSMILHNREIFEVVKKIVESNTKINKPNHFYSFLGSNYFCTQLMALRRQIKNSSDSISIVRLLNEFVAYPKVLSRQRFTSLYGEGFPNKVCYDTFDKKFGKGSYIDIGLINKDVRQLEDMVESCEDYADKRIAHYDKRKPELIPNLSELDGAINLLEELTKKYLLLLRAIGSISLKPIIQDKWKYIFREKWIES